MPSGMSRRNKESWWSIKNLMSMLRKLTLIVLAIFAVFVPTSLVAQINYDDEFPKFYMETEDTFERLKELPRDTVRDTVYINYFEEYIRQYVGSEVALSAMLQDFDAFQRTMDSIRQFDPDAYRLFYNFILPRDGGGQVSRAFAVREVNVDYINNQLVISSESKSGQEAANVDKAVMFRLSDRLTASEFLQDTAMIRLSLVQLFQELQRVGNPQSLMLVLPDFNYELKRELVQFVKSVRLLLDASRDFKFEKDIRLEIAMQRPDEEARHRDLLYALALEVSFLGLFDRDWAMSSGETQHAPSDASGFDTHSTAPFIVPLAVVNRDSLSPGFVDQLKSHYYIARFFPSTWDVKTANLTAVDANMASLLMRADYQANYWEVYLYILVGLFVVFVALLVLYYTNLSFSMFINNNLESVALVSVVLLLEVVAVVINIFQYMSEEDTFTVFAKNPILIFTFPLVVVAIVPILQALSKRRKIPRHTP